MERKLKNLPKRVLGKGVTLRVSPTYVTNGFWILRRAALSEKDQAIFADARAASAALKEEVVTATDEEIGGWIPRDGRELRDPGWIRRLQDGTLARCYLTHDDQRCYVMEDFAGLVDQLGGSLFTTGPEAALVIEVAGERTVGAIMPAKEIGDGWVPEELRGE